MHNSLGNALMVEVLDLLEKYVVFKQRRAALAGPERVFVVGNDCARLRGQGRMRAPCLLVQFSAVANNIVCSWMSYIVMSRTFSLACTRLFHHCCSSLVFMRLI
jgi:hypothetical protein